MFVFDFVFVKPHAVPLIFRLNVQTDYYSGHIRHLSDELLGYLGACIGYKMDRNFDINLLGHRQV